MWIRPECTFLANHAQQQELVFSGHSSAYDYKRNWIIIYINPDLLVFFFPLCVFYYQTPKNNKNQDTTCQPMNCPMRCLSFSNPFLNTIPKSKSSRATSHRYLFQLQIFSVPHRTGRSPENVPRAGNRRGQIAFYYPIYT